MGDVKEPKKELKECYICGADVEEKSDYCPECGADFSNESKYDY